jgi:hypothetical protein
MNPTINLRYAMLRIAAKVHRAAERISFLSATGTQAVLRCGGKVFYVQSKTLDGKYVN